MEYSSFDLREYLDFNLHFCREIKPDLGEDSFAHGFCADAGILAVFDGCGGLGAQTRQAYSNKTEAYMASRMVSGAVCDWFADVFPLPGGYTGSDKLVPGLRERYIDPVLQTFQAGTEGGFRIKGTMSRVLPTTMAMALVQSMKGSKLSITCVWAGDSRVYILTPTGLAQLTPDDCTQPDPMENLYNDGILTNVLSADGRYELRTAEFAVHSPCVVLSATDGCFGYLFSPMEFEGLLLSTLMEAGSPSQWEFMMAEAMGAVAGDDYTLELASFGFGSYQALQGAFRSRYDILCAQYLKPMEALDPGDRMGRTELWQHYRSGYLRYMGGV